MTFQKNVSVVAVGIEGAELEELGDRGEDRGRAACRGCGEDP